MERTEQEEVSHQHIRIFLQVTELTMFGIMSQQEVMIPQAFSLIFIIILDISLRLTHNKYL